MPPFEQIAKFAGFAKSSVASEAEAFLKTLGQEAGEISLVSEEEQLAKGLTPTGSGTSLLSHEELARQESFYKVTRGGALTYLGKQPDAPLRAGEAVLALHRQSGAMRVVNEMGNVGNDLLGKFGPSVINAAAESGVITREVHKEMLLKQAEELAERSLRMGEGHDTTTLLNRNMHRMSGSRRTNGAL